MNKLNSNLLIILLFALGVLLGSFAGISNTAGRATRSVDYGDIPVLTILPDIARPGNLMAGSVTPGSKGVLTGVRIYRLNDYGSLSGLVDECVSCFCPGNSVCYNRQEFTYALPESVAPGFYSACITEAGTDQRACATFQVG